MLKYTLLPNFPHFDSRLVIKIAINCYVEDHILLSAKTNFKVKFLPRKLYQGTLKKIACAECY